MKLKKLLGFVLALAMVLSLMPAAFAAGTTTTITVGAEKTYTSLKDALTAANAMTGDVIVEIYGAVEFNDNMELNGSYDSISFVGKTTDAKITINKTQSWCQYLESNANAFFTDLILDKANLGWTGNSGHMGNYFSIHNN